MDREKKGRVRVRLLWTVEESEEDPKEKVEVGRGKVVAGKDRRGKAQCPDEDVATARPERL